MHAQLLSGLQKQAKEAGSLDYEPASFFLAVFRAGCGGDQFHIAAGQCPSGNGRRQDKVVALVQRIDFSGDSQTAAAFDDASQGVGSSFLEGQFRKDVPLVDSEIVAFDESRHGVAVDCAGFEVVRRILVRNHRHIDGLLDMQVACVALIVLAVEVVDAVCRVAALLRLQNRDAAADGMDGAARNEEEVAFLHFDMAQKTLPVACGDHFRELFFCLGIVSVDDFGIVIGIDDVPAFGFPQLAFMLQSISIIRMHLDG